uniref:Insertion element IS406 uncharacterized 13.3 kDa protein n=1 Tax=Burkholderia multivorans (strain ATCC 17616 / 249) TaxID=395019 RepID=YI62_BURM1|nr:RecName: Full=Insertion element IS406 uncharacterized 13.3 kDa protein; AltName: Full=ORF2 [Burkholderia multivorans ATCC 17616]AAA25038.1 ORF2 [Burkholderia cepacia]
MLATRVRRRSSRLIRSRPLVVRSRMRCAAGKSNTVRLSGMAVSAHSASFGCSLHQRVRAAFKSRSASVRSGALKMARIWAATVFRASCRVVSAPAFCCRWNWQRCQGTEGSTARRAALSPA